MSGRIQNTEYRTQKAEARSQKLEVRSRKTIHLLIEKLSNFRSPGLSVFWTLFLAFGLVVWVACTNKNKIPSDVLPREDMEKVMWDMIQADRFSSQFMERDSTLRKNIKIENLKQYERVFQIHKITREEFIHSFKFYLSRPDINRVLYDTMAARANRRRSEVYTNVDTAK